MNCDLLNLNILLWPILPIHLDALQLPQRRQPLITNDMPKHGILPIQMRRLVQRDEELTPVRAWSLVRHANDAACVVSQGRADLVLEGLGPDGGAAFGLGGGRAGLDHEGGYEAVEGGGVVVSRGAEGEEVLRGFVSLRIDL